MTSTETLSSGGVALPLSENTRNILLQISRLWDIENDIMDVSSEIFPSRELDEFLDSVSDTFSDARAAVGRMLAESITYNIGRTEFRTL